MKRACIISFCLFLICETFAQNSTTNELGEQLWNSIQTTDEGLFRSLIMPKEVFVRYMEEKLPYDIEEVQKEAMLKDIKSNYEEIISPFIEKFHLLISITSDMEMELNISNLEFEKLGEIIEDDGDKSIHMHATIPHKTIKHLSYFTINFDGAYYLYNPEFSIDEDQKSNVEEQKDGSQ